MVLLVQTCVRVIRYILSFYSCNVRRQLSYFCEKARFSLWPGRDLMLCVDSFISSNDSHVPNLPLICSHEEVSMSHI